MEAVLRSVHHHIQSQSRLRPILNKLRATVVFKNGNEAWYLSLVSLERKGADFIYIEGKEEKLSAVVTGDVPLRQMQRLNKVQIQGNYRQILLLEALFLLGKMN